MNSTVFNRATIIGLGLIGGSIARAMREHGLAETIVGCDQNEVSLAFARKEGFIDIATSDIKYSVTDSDLVIIATPPATLATIAQDIHDTLANNAIIMDMASVKQSAINTIAPYLPPHVIFIPTHPIAGSEQSGVRAGHADLFLKKRIIITPSAPPEEALLKRIATFWQSMGARVEGMPADVHDVLYGYMSHLPQLIAFALKKPLGVFFDQTEHDPVYKFFLRIAHSQPSLWAEIFNLNKTNVLNGLDRYLDVISHVHRELQQAPEGEKSAEEPLLAHTVLFPRIVASCVVTTVMEAEKNASFSFARYAGTGFADLTCPTLAPPEEDIERISAQYKLVTHIIGEFITRLREIRDVLETGSQEDIERIIAA